MPRGAQTPEWQAVFEALMALSANSASTKLSKSQAVSWADAVVASIRANRRKREA